MTIRCASSSSSLLPSSLTITKLSITTTDIIMNSSIWDPTLMGYSTVETLLDEVSNHMAASNISRHSRGSISQKSGVSMRVVKPNSASNSPRNSLGLGRRMTDGAYRRKLAMLEQGTRESAASFVSHDGLHAPPPPSARPVSWHPVSHIPQTSLQSTYPQQYSQSNINLQLYDTQTNHAVYSGYNSPASSFSPVSGPPNGFEQQYVSQNRPHTYNPYSTYDMNQQRHMSHALQPLRQSYPPSADNVDPSMYSHFDWSNFATNGFEDPSTTPPTPENFLPIQHPEPTFPADDAIPYHPLDESDEGEELIGMGLYDAPEAKSPSSDPHLDNYRALMMSQLLGTPYRRPEPAGKGLKLEEGWNPPGSEDGEDSDEDGDGEDEEEEKDLPATRNNGSAHHVDTFPSQTLVEKFLPVSTQQNQALQNYGRDGWL